MRKLLLASAGLCVLSAFAPAMAADLAAAPRYTKAPAAPVAIYNWTGFYVGGFGGYASENTSIDPKVKGGFAGGTIGYNWQTGPAVFGLEGDIDWSNIRGSSTCGAGFSCETKNSWLATARGRVGYAFDRFMPFVTGGLAVGDIKNTVSGVGSSTATKAGWTVGAGLEAALTGPWTAKVEYLYADLGRGTSVLGADTKFNASIVRAGLNYRF